MGGRGGTSLVPQKPVLQSESKEKLVQHTSACKGVGPKCLGALHQDPDSAPTPNVWRLSTSFLSKTSESLSRNTFCAKKHYRQQKQFSRNDFPIAETEFWMFRINQKMQIQKFGFLELIYVPVILGVVSFEPVSVSVIFWVGGLLESFSVSVIFGGVSKINFCIC